MGMIERLFSSMGYERRDGADPSWAALASNMGWSSAGNVRAAENLSAVLACSTVIASSLASIPALVYRREGDSRVEAAGHPLARLTRLGVSDAMTWPEFVEHLVASTLLAGNGLAEIKRHANGGLAGFEFIPWTWVTVSQLRSGRLAYDINNGRGQGWRLLSGEVIHLRDRTDDGLVGRSRLNRAADVVAATQASNTFARKFLDNSAMPGGVIESPSPIGVTQRLALREILRERYIGPAKAGTIMLLDGGMQWKAAQISPEDAELLETRKFGIEEICRIYQVPPPLVQDYSHNTFTNSETAGRWFAMFTLAPWARRIEAEFARSVFSSSADYELELDLSGFLRGDPATRWQAHGIALEHQVLDPNEVRQIEGWNPRATQTGQEASR
ncbi:MAG: phage portal protein [Sphingobium sp.]|nr:phage portal protein [Sphingobium sp.]